MGEWVNGRMGVHQTSDLPLSLSPTLPLSRSLLYNPAAARRILSHEKETRSMTSTSRHASGLLLSVTLVSILALQASVFVRATGAVVGDQCQWG